MSSEIPDIDLNKVKTGLEIFSSIYPISNSQYLFVALLSFAAGVYVGVSVYQNYLKKMNQSAYKSL